YDYNLAGQVKRISYQSSAYPSDNSYVDYAYDGKGRVISVASSPFAGVTNLVSGIKYRAWDAVKTESYGNNITADATYDNELQLQGLRYNNPRYYELHGTPVIGKSYSYYPDGRIKFSDDDVDEGFDRAFQYDHLGRLQEAWTGSQARNVI